MDEKRIQKLRGQLANLRRGSHKARDFEQIAKQLGRKKVKRGKEPVWESQELDVFPLSIPHHGGRDLSPGVRNNVLNQLENDLLAWEDLLQEQDDEE